MAEWEKVVSLYDTLDRATAALNVLKSSGIDVSDLSLLDRNTLGTGVDSNTSGCGAVFSGKTSGIMRRQCTVTRCEEAARSAVRTPKQNVAKVMSILDVREPVDVHEHATKIGVDVA